MDIADSVQFILDVQAKQQITIQRILDTQAKNEAKIADALLSLARNGEETDRRINDLRQTVFETSRSIMELVASNRHSDSRLDSVTDLVEKLACTFQGRMIGPRRRRAG
jgi:hypothetical protein